MNKLSSSSIPTENSSWSVMNKLLCAIMKINWVWLKSRQEAD